MATSKISVNHSVEYLQTDTSNRCPAIGFVTNSKKQLQLYIFANFPNVSQITEVLLSLRVPTGGYLFSEDFDATQYINQSGISKANNTLFLSITKNNEDLYSVNNIPVVGIVKLKYKS